MGCDLNAGTLTLTENAQQPALMPVSLACLMRRTPSARVSLRLGAAQMWPLGAGPFTGEYSALAAAGRCFLSWQTQRGF